MNVYEQQARALKEIAAELKGIRRALDIIGKSLKPDGYRADITIIDELAGRECNQAVEHEEEVVYMCSKFGGECDKFMPAFCSDSCKYRVMEGADNG